MISILALSNLGISSSLLLKMKLEEMLEEEGIKKYEVYVSDHCSVTPERVDLIFTSPEKENFVNNIRSSEIPKIIISNLFDKSELREKGLALIKNMLKNSTLNSKYAKSKIS